MPEISIIIPVFNGEKFIDRCYKSILAQTFSDFEIIFIDDGSKDNSQKILNSLKDNRTKIITQENKKQGGARNTGLRAASGRYISFIDIDDFISPTFLEALYSSIKKSKADISVCNIVRYKNKKRQKFFLKYEKEETYEALEDKIKYIKGNGSGDSVWNKLYKKDFLLENNLFFREGVFYEDTDFSAKCLYYSNKISTAPNACYYYFANPTSVLRKKADGKKQKDKYEGLKAGLLFELEHNMKTFGIINKYDFNFLGLNFLRVKEKISLKGAKEEWYLFDFIKVFQK